ncbi:tRNA (N6-threonylcarbamoyladenosine(37)-N6)-methyltransferase TrmO [Desulfocucumis palustris]|nr:tRNA (N6-threonylcarbamoyladenosine(37)-N6)-methyltransferase TrmO [Desulfocucumis palustris]
MLFQDIVIKPVGVVQAPYADPTQAPILGYRATVEVFPDYANALLRIEEHSHFWILTWFHQARRNVLVTVPGRINPNLPEYGVFGLRSPVRPNPVGLSLVQLESVEGNKLHVTGLDAIDGTPVIDIKPYFENDIIFSPRTPHMRPLRREVLKGILLKRAIAHHQEECPDLLLAVRMTMLAEESLGHINSPDLQVAVTGSACLADTLQGLTRARLANPPRFRHQLADSPGRSDWSLGSKTLSISARRRISPVDFWNTPDSDIFTDCIE